MRLKFSKTTLFAGRREYIALFEFSKIAFLNVFGIDPEIEMRCVYLKARFRMNILSTFGCLDILLASFGCSFLGYLC